MSAERSRAVNDVTSWPCRASLALDQARDSRPGLETPADLKVARSAV